MDIHEIISQINNKGYKLISDFLNSYCIINGSYQSLEEIQKMSLENFNYRVRKTFQLSCTNILAIQQFEKTMRK